MPVDFGTTDPKRDAEACVILKQALEMAKNAQVILERQRRLVKEPAIKAQMGEISKQIYENNQIAQADFLSALPNELKCSIWSFIDNPADRLMFALTCKWNSAIFETLKTGPTAAESKSTSKASKSTSGKASTASASKKALARKPRKPVVKKADLVYLIPVLQRLQDWIHPRYKLCYECLRFRRKDLSKEKGLEKSNWTKGVAMKLKKGKLSGKEVISIRQDGAHCPECSLRRKLDVLKMKGKFKELSQIVDKTVGLNS